MIRKSNSNERGQALVVIALAAVGLFAFAALAIDGSMIFSDRRHAQNAADTAVLDAALAYIRQGSSGDWVNEGLARASSNGYNNDGTTNIVSVDLCSTTSNPCDGLPAGADPSKFIQVQITSNVSTAFARIIGVMQITNRVEAVAEVVPSEYSEMFDGHAVVGLAEHDCHAVTYQGNADTTISGGGILVMSDCSDSAFFNHSSAAVLHAPSLCAVGGVQYNPSAIDIPSIRTGCEPPPQIVEPNVQCSGAATQTGNLLSPGNWSGQFPPAGVDTLQSGIYCIDGVFHVNGGDSLTGVNVVIKMVSGDVSWNGGASVHLEAPTSGDFDGLLLYMPSSNCEDITLNGNSESTIVGTILAPCADVHVDGTGDSGIVGQIIGYTVDLSGTSSVEIHYDDQHNYDAPTQPQIKITD